MTKMAILMMLITLGAVAASPAMAQREWRGGHGSGPGNVADIAGIPGLNLTPEQAEKIGALREAHRREIKPLQGRLRLKGADLRNMWLATTPDRDKILALQREVRDLRDQIMGGLAAYRLAVREMLTPEQQEKIRAFEMERRRGGGEMEPRRRVWRDGGQPAAGGFPAEKHPGPASP